MNGTDLPLAYRAADANSLSAQQLYNRLTAAQLVSLAVAGLGGVVGTTVGSVTSAVAFGIALLVRGYLLAERPEREWYDGRAIAESVKTLAWQYSVKGGSFGADIADPDQKLINDVNEVVRAVPSSSLTPGAPASQITENMRALRSADLEERRRVYREARIRDQLQWYTTKAAWNKARHRGWSLAMLSLQVIGLGGATARAAGLFDVDVLGVTAAVAASAVAWSESKQRGQLAQSYSVAAQELSSIDALVGGATTDEKWERFVEDAEQAISREHTLWRARHA